MMRRISLICGALLVLAPVASIGKGRAVADSPNRASTQRELGTAKSYFDGVLFDGVSARWKDVRTWRGGYVCGSVNAKNRMGAYVGWHQFWYRAGEGGVVPGGSDHDRNGAEIPCLKEYYGEQVRSIMEGLGMKPDQ